MRIKIKKSLMMCLFFLLVIVAFGCANDTNTEPNDEDNTASNEEGDPDPVTLQVVVGWDEEMFNNRFKDPIEEAFPWMTIEQIKSGSGREELEEVFAKDLNPDIIFEISPDNMEYFGLEYDLDELIEKHGYDVSHINPVYLDAIRAKDPDRRLLGMPYEIVNWVLFYNKDIFDTFGVDYPTEDMTWKEAIDLASKVSGERNGVHYRGLDLGPAHVPFAQFSVNRTDPETGEVLIQEEEEFARYLDLIQDIGALDNSGEPFFESAKFTDERSTAMFVEFVQAVDWWSEVEGLNYDVTALPTWEGEPAVTHRPDFGILNWSISPLSENKDAAFEAITHFTETEYQTFASRIGLGPTSAEDEVLEQFFQDYESTHDKNMQSIFAHPPASPPEQISRWDEYVDFNVHRWLNDEEYMNIDRNEYLRIVAEESAAKIQEAMGAE
ncbi:hypothetical protein J14TS2_19730 [Bacillus sp. J14TS2]|uniref:ABC transporter substrate-binding protein n=1 Tax=Bacillus sp. J14TS2 TaxID=2807188 RepID=UPI001B0800BF|nr:extracellular solute-binding protein [Bacillus sp. J14TS2]GIN71498.1 hypothetical protein J14TS2_19730 [Bacillus sp. J14TS2]